MIKKKPLDNSKINNIKKEDNKIENEQNEKIKNTKKNIVENESTIENIQEKNSLYQLRIFELENKLKNYEYNLRDIRLRSQAEVDNIRRRSQLDIEKIYKFSLEKFINELLPVIDSLEKASEISSKNNTIEKSIIEGIQLTLKSLLNTIKKFGIDIINEINIPFNPSKHQAMSIIESNEIKDNYIIKVIQKGYTLNKRLLRPAMVIIAKEKK
ncbi:nucleotide exchange factor GrpE [Enterobacteriaceae endosymbiont of Plateumaris consimilis]|uniref:nucleotide exchange factor GrpE n=1 Tax=Enterobacteriaceae endosymbiont of Plateumaris consimilis TaxID=2675794 RepID=UPI0014491D16|nr:nucleotide exchange factor GrpE [Enterobacteriaceae endosymbiont of Plateumaris consimilis]QJC28788.1 nucleotide exchange factor GrpE [Enterobacteriaceae endosymbiont of Plateumaris consimilis]